MSKNVLVVAPHPDDETLGCGGSLLKHKANGDNIYWLIITNVFLNKPYNWNEEKIANRQIEIDKVSGLYGFNNTFKLDFPTTELDSISTSELIGSISKIIYDVQPEIIYLPNCYDIHTDHQLTFKAAYSCTKNFRYPFIKRILMYETLSETEFVPSLQSSTFNPNVFVDITEYFGGKLEILKIYKSEIMKGNMPRSISSIESLARFRGSQIGVKYSESFQLLKDIL